MPKRAKTIGFEIMPDNKFETSNSTKTPANTLLFVQFIRMIICTQLIFKIQRFIKGTGSDKNLSD